jgi:hypothetical protein
LVINDTSDLYFDGTSEESDIPHKVNMKRMKATTGMVSGEEGKGGRKGDGVNEG